MAIRTEEWNDSDAVFRKQVGRYEVVIFLDPDTNSPLYNVCLSGLKVRRCSREDERTFPAHADEIGQAMVDAITAWCGIE